MSELFLDTEIQYEDLNRIAHVLGRSAYTLAELRRILQKEVAPAFGPNLLSIAGEWAGWRQEDVREIMLKRLRRPNLVWSWLMPLLSSRLLEADWQALENRIAVLRSE